jgi:hypothetical protein
MTCEEIIPFHKRESPTELILRESGYQAGGRGFEPRHTDPESAVLPLDEPPTSEGHFTMFGLYRQISRICYNKSLYFENARLCEPYETQ